MSKYTTEVRYICEQKSELEESKGFTSVDDVINKSWNKIFTTNVNFFDENYKQVICKKILKHYYMREIGCETVGLWMLWINTRLEEIMPYYNQLYSSEKLEYNPLNDVNVSRTHKRTNVENKTGESTRTGDKTANSTKNNTNNVVDSYDSVNRDLFSNTPQGALTGIETEKYLTDARKVTQVYTDTVDSSSEDTVKSTEKYSENNNITDALNSTEDYIETITGKQGTENYSDMINKFRNNMLNIDMQVIEEFSDLFMGLW